MINNFSIVIQNLILIFIFYKIMSLFIVGSVSRITANIIHQLSRNSSYKSVTICDLLPHYDFHHRFYRLQKELQENQSTLSINLSRLTSVNDLQAHKDYQDVLYVTHDYYKSVTSKTKIMQLLALSCKHRQNLYFATPAEYDHFGYDNPEQHYLQSQNKVRNINPNSTFIRSGLQSGTQIFASIPLNSVKANIVNGESYARIVSQTISNKVQGKLILVEGTTPIGKDQVRNLKVQQEQYKHASGNFNQLKEKYQNYKFEGYETTKISSVASQ